MRALPEVFHSKTALSVSLEVCAAFCQRGLLSRQRGWTSKEPYCLQAVGLYAKKIEPCTILSKSACNHSHGLESVHCSVAPQDRLVEAQAVLAFNLNPKDSACEIGSASSAEDGKGLFSVVNETE